MLTINMLRESMRAAERALQGSVAPARAPAPADLFGAYPASYGGVRILESLACADPGPEDWSEVRSPARARRRRRMGHRQRIKQTWIPRREAYSIDGGRTIVMHPVMAAELKAKQLTV
jgi:hypothetical protein